MAPQQHRRCIITRHVDDRHDRTAKPLVAASPAPDFGPHCGTYYQLLLHWVGARYRQAQQLNKRQASLSFFLTQAADRLREPLARSYPRDAMPAQYHSFYPRPTQV
jgi:hypothetical protein